MAHADPSARPTVAVLIPAYAAAETVGRAVRSALREPEVAQVIVVDDASPDDTGGAALAADDGSGRLQLHRMEANGGPSAARNAGLALATAPLVALLDADDAFVPGRLRRLLAVDGWDLIADDIAFTPSEAEFEAELARPRADGPLRAVPLDLVGFADGNIPRSGAARRELGFLHPVMRRAFLEEHGLRYDETMRLGEDYDLYARALAAGARFLLTDAVGYVALERPGSLSGTHRTHDLARFRAAVVRLAERPDLSEPQRRAVRRHLRDVERRLHLRQFLDEKRAGGVWGGAAHLLRHPRRIPSVAAGVARDKLAALQGARADDLQAGRRPRTLFAAR